MTRVAAVPPIRGLRDGSSCTDRERVPNCLGYFAHIGFPCGGDKEAATLVIEGDEVMAAVWAERNVLHT